MTDLKVVPGREWPRSSAFNGIRQENTSVFMFAAIVIQGCLYMVKVTGINLGRM